MPARSAWVIQAYREHHAGRLSLTELARVVREHRADEEPHQGSLPWPIASADDPD